MQEQEDRENALAALNENRLQVSLLEKPSYQVLKTIRAGRFKAEIRHYEPYLIAESTVTGKTMSDGTSKGFINVARYGFFPLNDYYL